MIDFKIENNENSLDALESIIFKLLVITLLIENIAPNRLLKDQIENEENLGENTTPYVYCISHKITGKMYIGCRTRKGCHPSELLRPKEKYIKGKSKGIKYGYWSSSKLVKELVKLDKGYHNFRIEEIIPWENTKQALLCESLLQKFFDLENDEDYLNKKNEYHDKNRWPAGQTKENKKTKSKNKKYKSKFASEEEKVIHQKRLNRERVKKYRSKRYIRSNKQPILNQTTTNINPRSVFVSEAERIEHQKRLRQERNRRYYINKKQAEKTSY
ncbi:hypothetical protein C8R30_101147 [Nitrosomonas nitrosa]|uniref:hypothetical protein n=1 Tax=Nitrosomonas nitrosa TaxID=52442 RepID=UPI000D2FE359|nr:hypothetical protein [Nitrosomonas nitrosa]PTR04950.1 hypothetical protein C8R30_101147 [Nitrosomonas nitrosa]